MEQYFPKRAVKPILREMKKRILELFKADELTYNEVITTVVTEFSSKYDILKQRNRSYFAQVVLKTAKENDIDITVFKDRGKARSVLKRREYHRDYKKKRRQRKALIESGTDPERVDNF